VAGATNPALSEEEEEEEASTPANCLVQTQRSETEEQAQEDNFRPLTPPPSVELWPTPPVTQSDAPVEETVVPEDALVEFRINTFTGAITQISGPAPTECRDCRGGGSSSGSSSSSSNSAVGDGKQLSQGFAVLRILKKHRARMWVSFVNAYQQVRAKNTASLLTSVREDQPSMAFLIALILLAACVVASCFPITRSLFSSHRRPVYFPPKSPANPSSPISLDGIMHGQPRVSVCQELCVPKDRECRLFAPRILEVNAWASIRSSQGEAILRTRLIDEQLGVGGQWLSLMSPDQQKCYGFAKQHRPGVLTIYSGGMFERDAQQVAELKRDRDRGGFLLEGSGGLQVFFSCNMQTGTLEVTDGQRLMAVAVPESSSSSGDMLEIRVGPGVDVGLVILVLLGTGLLLREGSGASSNQPISSTAAARAMAPAVTPGGTAASLMQPPQFTGGSTPSLMQPSLAPGTGSSLLAPAAISATATPRLTNNHSTQSLAAPIRY